MQINKIKNGTNFTIEFEGRLDTITTPEVEKQLDGELEGITELVLDLKGMSYLSSAGLRLILSLQKKMMTQGSMEVRNVNEMIMEIFEVTGFDDILTIV